MSLALPLKCTPRFCALPPMPPPWLLAASWPPSLNFGGFKSGEEASPSAPAVIGLPRARRGVGVPLGAGGVASKQLGMSPTHPHNPNSRGRSRSKSGSAATSTRDAGAGDADAGDAGGGDADAVHEITAGLRKHKPTHPIPCPSPRAAPRHHTTRAQCREVSASPLALPNVCGHSLTADTSRHHEPCSPSPACSWHVSEVSP